MQASSCTCGKIVVLDRKICPNCGKLMKSIEIKNDAVVLTHTTLNTVPEGFKAPIFLVLVELEKGIKFVYIGNLHDEESTHCPECNTLLVKRIGYDSSIEGLGENSKCRKCGYDTGITL